MFILKFIHDKHIIHFDIKPDNSIMEDIQKKSSFIYY